MMKQPERTPEQQKKIDDSCRFADMVATLDLKGENQATSVCPVCGGTAIVIKSAYNGHRRGNCIKCGMSVIQ